MTDHQTAPEILTLARLCGIQPEFQDFFGVSHCIPLPTMEALLTAMGVPCATPGEIRDSLEDLQEDLYKRLLPPVSVVTPESGGLLQLNVIWPKPEVPFPLDLAGELTGEGGDAVPWQPRPDRLIYQEATENKHGYLLKLALPLPAGLADGYYDLALRVKGAGLEAEADTRLAVSPGRTWLPPALEEGARLWGLNLPLYALKSRRNWGIGDFTDLKGAITMARDFGAAFVGVNPLHAPQEGPYASSSPYSPTSRLFLNYLAVDLMAVPEMQDSPEAQALLANPAFQAGLDRLREAPLVDYPEVRRIKRKFFDMLFTAFIEAHGLPEAPRTPRGRDFASFVAEKGPNLKKFSLFQAISDHLQENDWRRWPADLQGPDTAGAAAFAREHRRDLAFHQYVQWHAAGQRREVWGAATAAGLPFTLYQDIALGATAGGFESWGYPGLFANQVSMGAPPDDFNPRGQDWGLPPMIPQKMAHTRFSHFIDTLRANLPPDGIVRLDHVMSLFRLFWIPAGLGPGHGTYITYPSRELLGLLTLESQRRRTLVIGEDLGTVAPGIRLDLHRAGIFSYKVFYFERTTARGFLPPEDYLRQALACVTTHDLPTLAGYWEGRDLIIKNHLHIYPSPHAADEDAASRAHDRLALVEALVQQHLLPPDYTPPPDFFPEELRRAVLAYLGQSQAALMEVRLEELLGLTAQQNLPGTLDQHPNWQQKISQAVEDMQHNPEVIRLAATLRQARSQANHDAVKGLAMPTPTLIYNLFPPLFGPIPAWEEHLDRIADMGFTWIYLNPINTPGLSGSLYAVKDYYAINPLLRPASGEDPEEALSRFLKAAERRKIRVMLDLVFNHTAIDSPLTVQHRDWFAVDEDGRIKNPSAIDPADATKITVWGDLAELEYWPPPDPEGLRHFWDQVISYYLRLGFTGFRADAAYKVPGDFWGLLIGEARAIFPEVRFFAETLGCRLSELGQLRTAGFDFIYNSSKWWDFKADWCLDQYNRFRHLAPSISFPESHDTDRLAKESGGSVEVARQRYLFAAFFSTGLMITSGFEYGFKKKLHVVNTRPEDWEEKRGYDLGTYISQVNRMKKGCPVLLEEGPMVRLDDCGNEGPVTCLVKSRESSKGRVLAVINTTGEEQQVKLPHLAESLGEPLAAWEDLTPDMIPLRPSPSSEFPLAPYRMRLFYNPQGEPLPEPELQPATEGQEA